jgi:hypothetical protein
MSKPKPLKIASAFAFPVFAGGITGDEFAPADEPLDPQDAVEQLGAEHFSDPPPGPNWLAKQSQYEAF